MRLQNSQHWKAVQAKTPGVSLLQSLVHGQVNLKILDSHQKGKYELDIDDSNLEWFNRCAVGKLGDLNQLPSVEGLPFNYWSWNGFSKVTSELGSLVNISGETKSFDIVDSARLLVLTSSISALYWTNKVEINGQNRSILVVEDFGQERNSHGPICQQCKIRLVDKECSSVHEDSWGSIVLKSEEDSEDWSEVELENSIANSQSLVDGNPVGSTYDAINFGSLGTNHVHVIGPLGQAHFGTASRKGFRVYTFGEAGEKCTECDSLFVHWLYGGKNGRKMASIGVRLSVEAVNVKDAKVVATPGPEEMLPDAAVEGLPPNGHSS
ncbi:hypothetical protein VNO78_19107 [Psophocarpus tetragonolobus]|uniref:Uncharacterized protein n=1 Tax=Psophocarpus tetragonolobus TaxID=3891 RepID=A0AAN9S8B3_PSOTE